MIGLRINYNNIVKKPLVVCTMACWWCRWIVNKSASYRCASLFPTLWTSLSLTSTSSFGSCRDANSSILAILEEHQVKDATVHWIEGAAEPFIVSPAMLEVVDDTDLTAFIHHAPTALLSVPLAPQTLQHNDAQGTLGKDRNKSDKVFAFIIKHVTSKNTVTDYKLGCSGACKQ